MTSDILFSNDRLTARAVREGDEGALQRVFEAAGDYFIPITGKPSPDIDAAAREIQSAAANPGRMAALLTRAGEEEPIGALGWWEGSPEPDITLLGMILLVPDVRGQGLAHAALSGLEGYLREREMTRMRTGVGAHDTNRQALVQALGFRPLDERKHVELDRGRMMLGLFEKELSTHG